MYVSACDRCAAGVPRALFLFAICREEKVAGSVQGDICEGGLVIRQIEKIDQ